jgi:purine-cytosine permease-like protein
MGSGTLIETRSIDYVPLAERHGKVWHLWPVWFSGDAHLATLAVGVPGVTLGGNLLWTAVAVVLGCLLGTFFMAFHSTQGPQLGLPQMIQSRPQFGYRGALLVWAVALAAYIGYNAFNQVLAAQAGGRGQCIVLFTRSLGHQRTYNLHACNDLTRVQVLEIQLRGSGLLRGSRGQGIPDSIFKAHA